MLVYACVISEKITNVKQNACSVHVSSRVISKMSRLPSQTRDIRRYGDCVGPYSRTAYPLEFNLAQPQDSHLRSSDCIIVF